MPNLPLFDGSLWYRVDTESDAAEIVEFSQIIWSRCFLANISLTHYGLDTPYGDIGLGQHWLR